MYLMFEILFLLFSLLQANGGEGQCVMRGLCADDPLTYLKRPCVYNGPPMALQKDSTKQYLKEVCTNLNAGPNYEVCCDDAQVEAFQMSLNFIEVLLKRCPSCYYNFANLFCQLHCSPSQSSFLEVKNSTIKDNMQTVNEVDYYVSEKYAQGLFDSCKNVRLASTTAKAIEMMCGAHGTDCSPQLWLNFLGANDPSPYQINFKLETTESVTVYGKTFQPLKDTTVPCSQPPTPYEAACSSVDCPLTV